MPLHGKIVVIKRSGGDGTEFPLTATCLFGRKPDCDIRIQLPQVSKEHCRIDFNENKEVILTNLSAVNPICVNGEVLKQSDRLKHGDLITIIDRSFRFEYPPAPTPKKRSSRGGRTETLKVLQDQQVGDSGIIEGGGRKSAGPHLKDGTNIGNIQRSLDKTLEMESKEEGSQGQSKNSSPFNDLYQMIKKSLDVKTPRKSSVSVPQTPSSSFSFTKPTSVRKSVITEDGITPRKDGVKVFASQSVNSTPQSMKKQRRSSNLPCTEVVSPGVSENSQGTKSEATPPRKRNSSTPKRFTVGEVIEQITATPKSPGRRKSEENKVSAEKASPKEGGSTKRKSGELGTDLPDSKNKRKRVSFGGYLSPEFFDKRLPPDSPLRKGAAPRRSLSLLKPKRSLLRRASVIGLMKGLDGHHPTLKSKTKSPKNASPAPAKASPKSKVASPKVSPKSKAASPKSKAASPKSKAASPKVSPKSKAASATKTSIKKEKSPSPKDMLPKSPKPSPASVASNKSTPVASKQHKSATPKRDASSGKRLSLGSGPASPDINAKPETPLCVTAQTPTVRGRFSVSLIGTPSPVTKIDAVAAPVLSVTTTPKIPLRRKSMKSTSKRTQNLSKSALKVIQRSGVSRASIKISNCWADVVKYGKPKAQVLATKTNLPQKKKPKAASKPKMKTPARKLKGHMSTGHADSPVTIVVGRAHKRAVAHSVGTVPKVVTNIALLKKNMKMDEDLTGLTEMFKTPVTARKRKSMKIDESKATETPAGQPTPITDPSALNTPEEPGEMMVSPLSVASTAKSSRYNSEAVQRLFDGDKDSGSSGDFSVLNVTSDSSELIPTDLQSKAVTPKQKPDMPECLTGVKRLMKTPRQKGEPVADLRGKLLKTPKQKPEPPERLSGVKRLMKTPKQKSEPIEDLRGKLLKTPKQKVEQEECLTGVKRLMKTPQQELEQPECLSLVKSFSMTPLVVGDVSLNSAEESQEQSASVQQAEEQKTPNQKSSPSECLTGVKSMMKTPMVKAASAEDTVVVKSLMKTPQRGPEQPVCVSEIKKLSMTPLVTVDVTLNSAEEPQEQQVEEQKTPHQRSSPRECLTGVKRMMQTPKVKAVPVEDMVGVKRLLQTPKEKGTAVQKNFGIKRLMKSPRLRGTAPVDDFEGLKELLEEPVEHLETIADENLVPVNNEDVAQEIQFAEDEHQPDDVSNDAENEVAIEGQHESVSESVETVPLSTAEENPCVDEPIEDNVSESLNPEEEPLASEVTEIDAGALEDVSENLQPEEEPLTSKVAEMDAAAVESVHEKKSVRGRRAKVVESKEETPEITVPVRARRGRKNESAAPTAATRGTRGRKAHVCDEVELLVEESAPSSNVPPKLKRGRKAKVVSEDQIKVVKEIIAEPEKTPEPKKIEQSPTVDVELKTDTAAPLENALKPKRGRKNIQPEISVTDQDEPQIVTIKDATEDLIEQKEVLLPHASESDCVPDADKPDANKKPVRGRRAKEIVDTQEAAIDSAPVKGRRGRKPEAVVKRSTRGRNANCEESPAESQVVTGTSPDSQDVTQENEPQTEEVVIKPQRGRKAKQAMVKDDDQEVVVEAKVEQAAEKPRRGRKAKNDPAVVSEEAEDAVVASTQPQSSVRGKRGRKAKLEEEEKTMVDNSEDSVSQQPAKKTRKTRDVHHDQERIDTTPPDEETTLPAVPKSRRGEQKASQEPESLAIIESNVQEVTAVGNVNEKPRRGRKPKQMSEEVIDEHEPEIEEKTDDQPVLEIVQQKKTRGTKTSEKNKTAQVTPAKRAREATTVPAEISSEQQRKRGRRAAAKPIADDDTVSTETRTSEDSNKCNGKAKQSTRCVRWRSDVHVFEIPEVTPVKATRGRKPKVDIESKCVTNSTEEENLSGKMVEIQPAKRARRGAKVQMVPENEETTSKQDQMNKAEQEIQPKTRRGRSAKK
uniref:Proliferation marker protein Ki-67-like n=1 Tax=Gouania willdenowi TaxID=441366 RepID=A0A8C5GT12_GOUWI